jgi:hypothetical protein
MENIFTISKHEDQYDDDIATSINIDDLYEKKRARDFMQLKIFNKMLRRIHVKIQVTSRQKGAEKICWFVVPEIMLGVPVYEQSGCIAYVMDKLKVDGFIVKYVHPNTLFISWGHWVPNYVISEIKSKTGVEYDNYGNTVSQPMAESAEGVEGVEGPVAASATTAVPKSNVVLNTKQGVFQRKRDTTVYRSTDNYKPQGNMVYDRHLLFDMSKKSGK